MATIDRSGTVSSPNGVNILNAKADNDPRKAVIFDDVADALSKLSAGDRAIGLTVKVADGNGGFDNYTFEKGTADNDFVLDVTSKGITNVPIYLGSLNDVSINPDTISETEAGRIATELNNRTALAIDKRQTVRIIININQTRIVAELNGIDQNIIIGNDANAITLNAKDILILYRQPLNVGTLLADANTQTITLNQDVNGDPQDISGTHTDIESYVNANGPYVVQPLNEGNTRFVVNINGTITNYLYNGNTGDVGGTGNYQTVADDFVEISSLESTTPDVFQNITNDTDTVKLDNTEGYHEFKDVKIGTPTSYEVLKIPPFKENGTTVRRNQSTDEPSLIKAGNVTDSRPLIKLDTGNSWAEDGLSGVEIDIVIEVKPFGIEYHYQIAKV